ncbi:MAG TPA: hypothetical protein VJN91_01320 [Gammaproteobacteria bacterium]|nr:hypothetical protein [Gammaproteobacteria bacterium]
MYLRHFICAAILALTSLSISAQDAAGKWNAAIESPQGSLLMVFEFAIDGNNLTGSMSNDFMGTTPISDGTINGNELAFKLSFQGPNGAMTANYKATVNGDEMTMTRTMENPPEGSPPERTFVAKRVEK